MYSFTEENYLKTIFRLITESGEKETSTNALAEALTTRAASVTDMLKRLADKELVRYEKYKGVGLSSAGERVALQVVRKHRLWECFLHEKLGFGWDEVHEIAEQLEHIHSEKLIDRLDAHLGFPKHDPHGDPIPDKAGKIADQVLVALDKVVRGQNCILSGVTDHSPAFLKSLEKWGLGIGTILVTGETNDFDGTLQLILTDGKSLFIGQKTAAHILVKLI